VDNQDSFTGSLVQQLRMLEADVRCVRSDAVTAADWADAALIVLSPGPGRPEAHPVNAAILRAPPAPVFGVCLGMQALAQAFGGEVVHARRIVHGRTSPIHHAGAGVFAGLPSPFRATRYHSLAVARASLPAALEITAWTADGEIMGLRHRTEPVEGVQFHPESVRTEHGLRLMANALRTSVPRPSPNGSRP
jgi:anthranilate synthase component 2